MSPIPTILKLLHEKHPDARYELNWDTPEQLLVATILAAQCTDERVNKVTETLFKKRPNARAFADAPLSELEEEVRPTGFYKQKAKTIQAACRVLVERFDAKVPPSLEKLITIPGVARKTANVVLNTAFNMPSGVIVDTHVARVSRRMGLSRQDRPERIEEDLMRLIPRDEWTFFGPAMVLHGRYTCTARKPQCEACAFSPVCDKRLE